MNPTSLEYLYQIAPPVPDRAPPPTRGDDDSSGFDSHLSQAASSVLDIVRLPSAPSARSKYSPSTRSTPNSDASAAPSDSASRPAANKPQKDQTTNDSNSQSNASAPDDKSEPTSRDDDRHDDKRDQDQSDAAPAAAAAGTAQPAAKQTAPDADSKDASQSDSDQAKDKIAADVLSKTPTAVPTTQTSASTKASDEAQKITVDTKATTEVAKSNKSATTAAADTAAPASEQSKAVSEKSTKTAARADKAAAVAKVTDSTKTSSNDEASIESAGSSATAVVTTASSSAAEALSAEDQSTAADAKPDSVAVGQTDHGHKDGASDNVQAGAPVTPAAANITSAVANVTVPSPVIAIADKPKQSDDATVKPVAEKTDATVGTLSRTLRTDLTSSDKSSSSGDASPVDIARFVSRVAKAVQTASDRDGVVNLRLSPAELGSLKIQLTVKDGVMSAAIEADNSNARHMLLDHLPALRDRLADQNIRVDRFDVDVKQENSGGQASPRGFNQNSYQQQAHENDSRRPATKASPSGSLAPAETVAAAPLVTSTGINLVI